MIAGAALLLWIFLATRESEPRWQGRTLSYWLTTYNNDRSSADAPTAVHNIGTNALPLLVKWIGHKVPMWRVSLNGTALSLGGRPLYRLVVGKAVRRQAAARVGFEILGPEAAPAVPALTNLLADWDWKSRAMFEQVVIALSCIGNDGLAPLVSVVTNKSAPGDFRWIAAAYIGNPVMKLDTNAAWAVPVLAGYLDDNQVALLIAADLGVLRLAPAVAVPALTQCLQDEQRNYAVLQAEAARSLGRFGKDAASAVPDLVYALGSTNKDVRIAATNALQSIAPEVLKNDGH
jgi:hypothetical protein